MKVTIIAFASAVLLGVLWLAVSGSSEADRQAPDAETVAPETADDSGDSPAEEADTADE